MLKPTKLLGHLKITCVKVTEPLNSRGESAKSRYSETDGLQDHRPYLDVRGAIAKRFWGHGVQCEVTSKRSGAR